jgi:hypothetical protein
MTIEQLDTLHQTRPFKPFTLHLADGSQHRVVSPEFLWRTPGGAESKWQSSTCCS